MKERPILFSGPMVKAILDDRKTQTRRVMKPPPIPHDARWYWPHVPCGPNHSVAIWLDGHSVGDSLSADIAFRKMLACCPYGQVGDRLWVRETWAIESLNANGTAIIQYAATPDECITLTPTVPIKLKRAVHGPNGNTDGVFRPSIHMPRWASRITLEITDIRVERIQSISEADVKAEGCEYLAYRCADEMKPNDPSEFSDLWDMINEKRGFGWNTNPWVWVIEFKRI